VQPAAYYALNLNTGALSVVDDRVPFPNGITISPDNKTIYVTNTPVVGETILTNITGTSTGGIFSTRGIYSYTIESPHSWTNRQLFYSSDAYIGDGIKTDTQGNIWISCGTGIDVVSPEGTLLGKIQTGTYSTNNLGFAPNGELWAVGPGAIWRVKVAQEGIINYG